MMEEREEETALICPACGWLLAALPMESAAEVPRCLACGEEGLHLEPVRRGLRLTRWPGWPGWAVYSRPALDRALVASESRN